MAKINIKSEKNKTFKGIFHVKELFSHYVGLVFDKDLGGVALYSANSTREIMEIIKRHSERFFIDDFT